MSCNFKSTAHSQNKLFLNTWMCVEDLPFANLITFRRIKPSTMMVFGVKYVLTSYNNKQQ